MAGTWFNQVANEGEVDGRYTRDYNEWLRWGGQAGGGGGGGGQAAPAFGWSIAQWTAAENEALAKLEPYYAKKLEEAQGDVNRAKQLIQEDYDRGLRYVEEDTTRETGQRSEDLTTQLQALGLDVKDETRETRGQLNQKGVLLGEIAPDSTSTTAPNSQYATDWFLSPLDQRQEARKVAIQRAITRQGELANVDTARKKEELAVAKKRGTEEQDIAFPRFKKALEEEKKEKAVLQMAPIAYQRAESQHNAVTNVPK